MARILKILPKGCRTNKRLKKLSNLKESAKDIQKRLDIAKQAKMKLDEDLAIKNSNLQRSIEVAGTLHTIV